MQVKLYEKYSSLERALITIAVMSATLIQVLDTTIVNVALPSMQGSLGATPDEITWVLTSYLVASAIFMPLTGYFTDIFGRKNYLLVCILGFIIASGLCGTAGSISQIVLFRMLQGVFGAALVPLSQTILNDIYPPEERGKAMAIWGIGVMIGPILGPTLGGYLTEIASWRWTFYINLPIGILSFLIAIKVTPDTEKQSRAMDWRGLALVALAIGGLQYVLDRGNGADWFESNEILIVSIASAIGFLGYYLHYKSSNKSTIIDLSLFKDKNFVISSSIISIFGICLFGSMVMLPLYLENLLHYPVLTTGFLMAPRGISAMVSMIVVSKLVKTIKPQYLVGFGLIFCGLGLIPGTFYNLDVNPWWIVWPLLVQGFGLGFVFVPLSAIAFNTLPEAKRPEAAGLFSLLRTIGSSIGISIIVTIFTRHTQIAWNQLGSEINIYNPALTQYLQSLNLKLNDPLAINLLASELSTQAQMLAFVDVYAAILFSVVIMLPLIFFIKGSKN